MDPHQINIEVFYASEKQQFAFHLQLLSPCTIEQAIIESDILNQCPEINLTDNKVGIFSKVKPLSTLVNDGDRIEIYRPLLIDPKAERIKKVIKTKKISRTMKRQLYKATLSTDTDPNNS